MLTRRDFIKGVTASILLSSTWASATELAKQSVLLNKQTIQIKNLHPSFQDYRILFISDLHHGPFLPESWFAETLNYIKNADYDILVLGGDYLCLPDSYLKRSVYPWHNQSYKHSFTLSKITGLIFKSLCGELENLKIKDGIIATYGNHDRWSAQDECYPAFKKIGASFLVNQSKIITRGADRLLFLGVDDFWTGFPKVNLKEFNQPELKHRIIVSHNPDFISNHLENEKIPFDLALCGHTHGGQIRIPGLGGLYYNIKDTRLASGLFTANNRHVFTSNGVGTVELPYRFNCPPEVCLLTLSA